MLQEEKFSEKKGVEEGTLNAVCFGDANLWRAAGGLGVRDGVFELCGGAGAEGLGEEEGLGD
jgi:hypothetical protein